MQGPEFLIPLVFFISIAVVIIVIRKFQNDERLALIEKGGDANIFKTDGKNNSFPALRYGLLLFGAGIGILVGNIVAEARIIDDEAAVFSFLLIFGGAGLFASYFIERKEAAKQKKE
ncbi:MAG: DUF6249 domain-containing protein [Reichenbachiella sp.]|uniref:DUF6249 domain-containing protein n=1 Tax=Reichenbachiella sp. TaxID=2184521 RepID=UPI0032992883